LGFGDGHFIKTRTLNRNDCYQLVCSYIYVDLKCNKKIEKFQFLSKKSRIWGFCEKPKKAGFGVFVKNQKKPGLGKLRKKKSIARYDRKR
jgi:hypothetical protein